jgi:hypothetical protein
MKNILEEIQDINKSVKNIVEGSVLTEAKYTKEQAIAEFTKVLKQIDPLAKHLSEVVNNCDDPIKYKLEDIRRGLSIFQRQYEQMKRDGWKS